MGETHLFKTKDSYAAELFPNSAICACGHQCCEHHSAMGCMHWETGNVHMSPSGWCKCDGFRHRVDDKPNTEKSNQ